MARRTLLLGSCALLAIALSAFLAGCGAGRRTGESVRVPDVTNSGLEYAYAQLRAKGLLVSVNFPGAYNQRDSIGASSQTPGAGSLVPRGSTVTLAGPFVQILGSPGMPGKRPADKLATVPKVVGLPVYKALGRLERAGLYSQLTRVPTLQHSAGRRLFDRYIVRSQSPRAGTRLRWAGILHMGPSGGAIDVKHSQVTLVPALH